MLKRQPFFFRFLMSCLGVGLFSATAMATPMVVTLCEDPWPPYTFGNEGEPPTGGKAVEALNLIFDRMEGVTLNLVLYPWTRCMREVEVGNVDGMMIAVKDPKRAYVVYPEPYVTVPLIFFYNKAKYPNGVEWETWEDLRPFLIGHITGSSFGAKLDAVMQSGVLTIDTSKTVETVFKKLDKGRIDLALSNKIAGIGTAKQLGLEGKFGETQPLRQNVYYFPISKKSPAVALIPQFNQIIQTLKKEGAFDKIIFE